MRQRVLELDAAQLLADRCCNDRTRELIALQALRDQTFRQDQHSALGVHQCIVKLGVQVERLIGRNGPGGGGPDHGERVFAQCWHTKGRAQLVRLGTEKAHIQRLRFLVGVFNFELGQTGAAVETPINRLQAAINEAAFDDALESPDLVRFVAEIHGAVGVVPVAQHTQALEFAALDVDLLGGKSAAPGLHLVARQIAAKFLFDGVFDGQAMAVPARNVDRIQPLELARFHDHVLQDLVDRVSHVNLAIGVRGAVVQHELGCTRAR